VAAYHLGRCALSMGFPRESRAGSMRIACESRTVPVTCIVIPHSCNRDIKRVSTLSNRGILAVPVGR
jgi:hypothetical protein